MKFYSPTESDRSQLTEIECILSPEGQYLYVPESVKELFGYKAEELIGKKHFEFLHQEDALNEYYKNTIPFTQNSNSNNFRFRAKSGKYFQLRANWQPALDEKV